MTLMTNHSGTRNPSPFASASSAASGGATADLTETAAPTAATEQWQALASHRVSMQTIHMRDLFAVEPQRAQRMSVTAGPLHIDYSKHRTTASTLQLLQALAHARGVTDWRHRMLAGEAINSSEGRAALHMALRGSGPAAAQAEARAALGQMHTLSEAVRSGTRHSASGKPFTDVIHIGIGGSDLGPRLALAALQGSAAQALRVHFVANIDPHELDTVLARCDAATTLVIIISKTFSTAETLLNAVHARAWLIATAGGPDAATGAHARGATGATGAAGADGADGAVDHPVGHANLIAVTNNPAAARAFGVPESQILSLPDWVGGRFSVWSAVGLSVMMAFGSRTFDALLAGAAEMDAHFISAPPEHNAPLILALLSVWNINFLGAQSRAVLPYSQRLDLLPDYLQQLEMESNGKRIGRSGTVLGYATAPVIFGNVGANSQHSFHQLLHQGTHLVPSELIVLRASDDARSRMLAVNALAQSAALMAGDDTQPEATPGNQPSTTIVLPELNAHTLGALLALYEHKVFVEGVLWDINSFDQPGVELGKRLASTLLPVFDGGNIPAATDASTRALLARIR